MLRGGLNLQPSAYLFRFWKNNKTAAMPPAYAHAKREWQTRQGLPGSRGYFCESNQRGTLGMPLFFGKPRKSAFRFSKSKQKKRFMFFLLLQKEPKGRFSVTFRLCEK